MARTVKCLAPNQKKEIVSQEKHSIDTYASLRPTLALNSYVLTNKNSSDFVNYGFQGQAGCGSGQPGLVVGDPAHSRGLKQDDHCGPFQPRPF